MHVLAGESAFRALRAARFRGLSIALPEPALRQQIALLPGQRPNSDDISDDVPPSVSPTLADSGFDFARVESNAKVELWRLGDVGDFTEEHPLELGVFDAGRTRRRKRSHRVVLSRDLPTDALIHVDPTLCFVCPELIVLHMASQLDAIALAQLIMELCGSYSPSPVPDDDGKSHCAYELPPVTTLGSIGSFARRFRHRGGTRTLHDALDLAMEGAASPAEANLALAMSLPRELGGYGFPKPALNPKLDVPGEEQGRVGGGRYFLDAFWQGAYADLEFESTEFHLDPLVAARLVVARDAGRHDDPEAESMRREYIAKADADRRRLRDLQCLGLQVIPVTSFDLQSVHRMDQVAYALARQFARHARHARLDADRWFASLDERAWREARHKLLQALQPHALILS